MKVLSACCLLAMSNMVYAELTVSADAPRLSTQDIMDILVSEKIISEQRATELLQSLVTKKTDAQIKSDKEKSVTESETALQPKVVRVPYVPEFVRDQIRDEVRLGLHDEVVNEYDAKSSPVYAASRLWIDEVISPVQIRQYVSQAIEVANYKPFIEPFKMGVVQV
ncbi:MAG: putative porin [Ignavibacteriales bacterium]|nr:putative porin [Ignavibacteriales bacterium]